MARDLAAKERHSFASNCCWGVLGQSRLCPALPSPRLHPSQITSSDRAAEGGGWQAPGKGSEIHRAAQYWAEIGGHMEGALRGCMCNSSALRPHHPSIPGPALTHSILWKSEPRTHPGLSEAPFVLLIQIWAPSILGHLSVFSGCCILKSLCCLYFPSSLSITSLLTPFFLSPLPNFY